MTRSHTLGKALMALACLAPAMVHGEDFPFHQRPGLWLIEMTMMGKLHHSKECITEEYLAFEKKLSEQVRQRNHCTTNQISHNPDGSWSETHTCTFVDGKTTTTHSTFRGDINSKFTASYDSGSADRGGTSVFTYAGPCPAGMRGGDVDTDGMVMNLMTMRH